ncbi:MAG: sugar phosphate isomerase/epimerase family protein [bacterium]
MECREGLILAGRAHNFKELEAVARAGLKTVEINLLHGQEAMSKPGELKDMAQQWGLSYLVHAPNEGDPKDLHKLGGAFLDLILRLMDNCLEIGARLLTIHFWMDRRFIPEEVVRKKARILARMVKEGESRGIRVSLENLSEDSQDLKCAMDESPGLGLTLDVGHGELMCKRNRALELLELFPKRVLHVHLHDNLGGDLVGDDLHLPVGEGKIDFRSILERLVGIGYEGAATLEVPLDGIRLSMGRILGILEEIRQKKIQGEMG